MINRSLRLWQFQFLACTTVPRKVGLCESLLSLEINPVRNQFSKYDHSTIQIPAIDSFPLSHFDSLEGLNDETRGAEDSVKIHRFCLREREREASLAVAHTASGLPRFEPLAVNNARAELPARPCTYTCGVLRRLIKQQLHTVRAHTMPSASPRTHSTRWHTK